jgi:hypothetical protein
MHELPSPRRQDRVKGKGDRWYHKLLRFLDYVVSLIGNG